MVLMDILENMELKGTDREQKKDCHFIQNVTYDLDIIKDDLKILEHIYNNFDDYKGEERLLNLFKDDKDHYQNCIRTYKGLDFIISNGECFYISDDFLTYSIKCRDLLTKIIEKFKEIYK